MGKSFLIAATGLFLVLGVFLLRHPVFAQERENDVYISPAITEKQLQPGESFSFELDLRNNRDETKTFYLFGSKFTAPDDESGSPQYNDMPDGQLDPIRWLSFSPSKLVIAANKTVKTTVTVTVPPSAQAGGYYIAAIASEKNPDPGQQTGPRVSLQAEIGSLILLTVGGSIKEEGKFIEVKPTRKIFWSTPVTIEARFQNTGNVHIRPKGVVAVESGKKKVADLELNKSGANTLPDSIRRYTLTWEPEKLFGIIPAFGSYKLDPLVGYGNPFVQDTNVGPSSFLLLPFELIKIVLIIALVAAVLFFGVFKAGQRRGGRRRRRR